MAPSTPTKALSPSVQRVFDTPDTPASAYFQASSDLEDTPSRPSSSRPNGNINGFVVPRSPSFEEEETLGATGLSPIQLKHTPSTPGFSLNDEDEDDHGEYGRPQLASGLRTFDSEDLSGGSGGSWDSHESGLEILHDENGIEDEIMFDDDEDEGDGDGDEEQEAGQPLVARDRRGRRRRRRRWEEEQNREQGLWELIPPMILAHPLPLFPLLALLPYNFLPAGVVFFIPIICGLAVLSCCAHIVIVYLAWYLKVPTFEDVFAATAGKYAQYGLWAGRGAVIVGVTGLLVSWLGTLHPLVEPVVKASLPDQPFFQSRILWTILLAMTLLPSLLPSRMTRSLRRAPVFLALLLPVVAFLIIGRTVEIQKAALEGLNPSEGEVDAETITAMAARSMIMARKFGLSGGSSAGAGVTTLTVFLSPHINTLPIHSHLNRNKRSSFPLPCLVSSATILVLSLPLALVPYYLLPALPDPLPLATPTTPSGVFGRLPEDDAWVNLARILMAAVSLGSINMWILRGRDTVLRSLGVGAERGDRPRLGKWVGLALWALVVSIACLGGWVSEKVELLGVAATIAVCWVLPSIFFIVTFHVRSPLAIVFPHTSRQTEGNTANSTPNANANGPESPRAGPSAIPPRLRAGHSRGDSLQDPTIDVLLARKEKQLQKRRVGRRLWQDLIVYVGIAPVGCLTLAWTLGSVLGIW